MTNNDGAVLRRAVDQLAELLDDVPPDAVGDPTPCAEWTVQDLVDHVVAAPAKFAGMARGESIDWSAPTPPAGSDPAAAFRSNADDLVRAWQDGDGSASGLDVSWMCAEFAVHTWDLATALRHATGDLDPEVADRGFAFVSANLTADKRGAAFDPEQPAPEGADPYQRTAAFAGRVV
ncbi:TIGR03086 family metal-binding protein [Saxibacter everestensis]|uniref:TIGR03086 family metal-binding protein n=1 Tax=Saxibacter everestensis TaxID=2909229 RepID=A0ABY8QU36_9MICO|nr:TIGR03086 family metal-binding protein [Brevibacteriaceae bacterium ZFBP1038]